MEYHDLVQDFAKRTQANLQLIDALSQHPDYKAYEVTQLVNSLLGLLVFPQQEFLETIPKTPLAELEQNGWPKIKITYGESRCQNLFQLARYLRNSVAHFNIKFTSVGERINGVRVWNTDTNQQDQPKTWEAELTVEDLRSFTNRFVNLLVHESSKPH